MARREEFLFLSSPVEPELEPEPEPEPDSDERSLDEPKIVLGLRPAA